MENRLCRMCKSLLGAALLLSTCGITYSCSDDLDVSSSTGVMGNSLYDELKSTQKFNYVTRMIDDLGLQEVLAKTGSRTMFVADDDAYDEFFKDGNNVFGVSKYEDLTVSQKKMLLNSGMLENAYLLEMMSNLGSTSGVTKNQCLRQPTSAALTDSVSYFLADQLPRSYNEQRDDDGNLVETEWSKYNTPASALRPGMYLALGDAAPMMFHFMRGHMVANNITDDDVNFILGNTASTEASATGDVSYINGVAIKSDKQDVACMNGYYNQLEKVMVAPQNMAEVIRTNSNTQIFSHMLDRFSTPVYNASLTQQFNALHTEDEQVDSVFQKRYYSERSVGDVIFDTNPTTSKVSSDLLSFDPAWSSYNGPSVGSQQDMAAMFVPNDDAMLKYFNEGGGVDFINRYAPGMSGSDINSVIKKIDQIPLTIIKELINNLMKSSFNSSVPSKYLTIMNDARDRMFENLTLDDGTVISDVNSYKSFIEKCLLANNGVVYVTKGVVTPASYASVAGPVIISDSTHVFSSVITADDGFIQGSSYSSAPLQQYFSTYMKAMQSQFTLFVPTDGSLATGAYVDPATYAAAANRRCWEFIYVNTSTSVIPVQTKAYSYNINSGKGSLRSQDGHRPSALSTPYGTADAAAEKNMLIEMVNQHLIVHDQSNGDMGVYNGPKYYLSRSGAPIYIKDLGQDPSRLGSGMVVQGGFQIWRNRLLNLTGTANEMKSNVIEGYDKTSTKNTYGNGYTYFIDSPMEPTLQSVADVIQDASYSSEFSKFWELAKTEFDEYGQEVLDAAGLIDPSGSETDRQNQLKYYSIFQTDNNYGGEGSRTNVHLFNNYRYTVYIPTNAALEAAENEGLPTWKKIAEYIDAHKLADGSLSSSDSLAVKGMATYIANFFKYHFQDNSVFVDNVSNTSEYSTSCVDNESNAYISINVTQSPGHIKLEDASGQTVEVNSGLQNIFARDMELNGYYISATYVLSSSYSVIHQINGVLNFDKSFSGSYNRNWSDAAATKAFVKKYRIRK